MCRALPFPSARGRRTLRGAQGLWCVLVGALVLAACRPVPDAAETAPGRGEPVAEAGAPPTAAERLRLSGVPLPEPVPKPDFVLTDTAGEPFYFREETAGYVTLLFFGYTSCPDVCPVHMANVAAVLRTLPADLRREIRVVFVGVDAPRDTPERVREFLDHFDRSFVGLTGTPEALEAAQRAAGVPPAFVEERFPGGYSVSHAGWMTLYSRDGLARLRYPFGVRQRELAHDLETLASDGWPEA